MSRSLNFFCSSASWTNAMIEASSSPVSSICPPNSSCCIITIGSAPRHMAAAKSKGFIGSSMYSAPKARASSPPIPLIE